MKVVNCMVDWLEFSIFDDNIESGYINLSWDEKKPKLVKLGNTIYSTVNLLGLEGLSFENRNGFYYKEQAVFDNCITISRGLKGNSPDNHVHVRITGKGCRFMERKLQVNNIREEIRKRLTWLLEDGTNLFKVKVSRMDICMDYDEKFVVKNFMNDVVNHNFKGAKSGSINGEIGKGITLYIGSRKSDKFFRLYEKDLESGSNQFKDRVELVLKDDYASFEFANAEPIENIISTYMSEIEFNTVTQEVWQGMQTEKCVISPKIRHKKTTLQEKTEYILNTYGSTLKAYCNVYGTKRITEGIHEGVYSNKDLRAIHNAKIINIIRAKNRSGYVQKEAGNNLERTYNYTQVSML